MRKNPMAHKTKGKRQERALTLALKFECLTKKAYRKNMCAAIKSTSKLAKQMQKTSKYTNKAYIGIKREVSTARSPLSFHNRQSTKVDL